MTERHCTIEAFCNNDSATDCRLKCYHDSFLRTDPAEYSGAHIWLHPPPARARDALLQYQRIKRKDPKTSACIVVPGCNGKQPWNKLLKGMELLKQYGSHDRACKNSSTGGKYAGGRIDIWYDPAKNYPPPPEPTSEDHPQSETPTDLDPPPESCAVVGGENYPDLLFEAKIGKDDDGILCVDTGATGDFITRKKCEKEDSRSTRAIGRALSAPEARLLR